MQNVTIEAQPREQLSRGKLSDLRKSGGIPAVLYGGAKAAKSKKSDKGQTLLMLDEKSFVKMLTKEGSNVLLELKVGVDMSKKLEVSVPLHLAGEAPGVKLGGGILEHITREVRVSCLPKDIPHQIDVDISKLEIGKSLSVADLPALE